MQKKVFFYLDLETTGLSALHHEIVQIAVIHKQSRFFRTSRSKHPMGFYARKATQIDYDTTRHGEPLSDCIADLCSWVEKYLPTDTHIPVFVAYNSPFDSRFLTKALETHSPKWRLTHCLEWRDAMKAISVVMGMRAKTKLSLAYYTLYNHNLQGAHNAMVDTLAMVSILNSLEITEHNLYYANYKPTKRPNQPYSLPKLVLSQTSPGPVDTQGSDTLGGTQQHNVYFTPEQSPELDSSRSSLCSPGPFTHTKPTFCSVCSLWFSPFFSHVCKPGVLERSFSKDSLERKGTEQTEETRMEEKKIQIK